MPILEVTTCDYSGRYEVREQRADGSLVIAPDTSIAAMRARRGSRAATPEEIRALVGDLPVDAKP